mmetsp:Transcript_48841/g.121172  ORF Transcript_48841/g.121172 Transcript_48841/m.121172 type:complete len:101 (-) Transcript_48841:256-558(-)
MAAQTGQPSQRLSPHVQLLHQGAHTVSSRMLTQGWSVPASQWTHEEKLQVYRLHHHAHGTGSHCEPAPHWYVGGQSASEEHTSVTVKKRESKPMLCPNVS